MQKFCLAVFAATAAAAPLNTAIVGGGPAGLLLAHKLLEKGNRVQIYEGRPDPRGEGALEGRAYALGLGLRGRTAIRSVDEDLWRAVANRGFGSDKFTLHLPFASFDLRKPDGKQEPSVLIYQASLCSALLDELVARHGDSGRLSMSFGSRVTTVDPITGTIDGITYDCIAGCDGVQSAVRKSMEDAAEGLEVETTELSGSLKVVRLEKMPAALAPDAVHLVPGQGGLAAFLEPTAEGCCALLSWRGSAAAGSDDDEGSTDPALITDAAAAQELLASSFPTLCDALNTTSVGEQFVGQRVSRASTVKCSTYNVGRCVLLGDAAHSTGGASGQGCNSALQDAVALADALERFDGDVAPAIASYSRARVPEGHALLDLSIGPPKSAGGLRRLRFSLSALTDSLLSKVGLSEPPLQTLLTTSLKPFAQIRRERESLLGDFPSDAAFAESIERASRPSPRNTSPEAVRQGQGVP